MPNRILREGINSSARVAQLDWPQEVFYRRLHSVVDDYGRTEANPQLLRARCYPLQTDKVRAADITRWIAACETAGLLLGYAVESKQYLELVDFKQKQRTPSKWPPPPANASKCQQMSANASLVGGGVVCVSEGEIAASGSELPESLRTVDFEKAWSDWITHRKEKKKPVTPTSRNEQIASLAEMGPVRAVIALRHSIKNGWTGIFEPERNNGTHQRSNAEGRRNVGTANEGRSSQYAGVGKV